MKSNTANLTLATDRRASSAAANASVDTLLAATSQIVSAYLVNRPGESVNLQGLTAEVYATLSKLAQTDTAARATSITSHGRKPVVTVEESVKADYLICLEDGKRVKMLKRHLKSSYNMTPEQYRARWELPANYPMVAPNYAKVRSNLAKQIGLGRRGLPAVAKRMASAAAVSAR